MEETDLASWLVSKMDQSETGWYANFSEKRVLVTGGLGFIGSRVARRLVELDAHITIIDRMDPKSGANLYNISGIENRVNVIIGDVCDAALIGSLVENAEKARLLRQYGWKERYISTCKGANSRLDELQAAILRVKLNHLNQWNTRRCHLAGLYHDELRQSNVLPPIQPERSFHVYHQYVIRCQNRDYLREGLTAANIQTQILYPVPIHIQPAFVDLGYETGYFPVTEQLAGEILSLPLYPEMNEGLIFQICQIIKANS